MIRPPRHGELDAGEVLVPGGWCWVGDDPYAFGPAGAAVVGDAFVIGRFPVTEPEFFRFISWLHDQGRDDEAVPLSPHDEPQLGGALWPLVDGRFSIEGRHRRLPGHGVDWLGADAYCRWLAQQTGRPYRLPGDVEWEKAARGVDARWWSPSLPSARLPPAASTAAVNATETTPMGSSARLLAATAATRRCSTWTASCWT